MRGRSIDATYEELLSTNRRFDTPIPLLVRLSSTLLVTAQHP